jgi:hypothetical protein
MIKDETDPTEGFKEETHPTKGDFKPHPGFLSFG